MIAMMKLQVEARLAQEASPADKDELSAGRPISTAVRPSDADDTTTIAAHTLYPLNLTASHPISPKAKASSKLSSAPRIELQRLGSPQPFSSCTHAYIARVLASILCS